MEIENALKKAGFTGNTSYEVFMLSLSFLSYVNLILQLWLPNGEILSIIFIVDRFVAAIFLIDFLRHLFVSKNKLSYMSKGYGWADLLSAVPLAAFNLFRAIRIIRFVFVARKEGGKKVGLSLLSRLASTALYTTLFLAIVLVEFGSIAVLWVEGFNKMANIKTASDALWYVYVSITTVGYGDRYPVTGTGRLIGGLTLGLGLVIYGIITAYIVSYFVERNDKTKNSER
jgi:voltage-gated potassium channel